MDEYARFPEDGPIRPSHESETMTEQFSGRTVLDEVNDKLDAIMRALGVES